MANLKQLSNQASIIVLYGVDTSSDGNIMPLHIYIKLLPRATKEQLVATKNDNICLNVYNRTTVTKLAVCKVKLQHNNTQIGCVQSKITT